MMKARNSLWCAISALLTSLIAPFCATAVDDRQYELLMTFKRCCCMLMTVESALFWLWCKMHWPSISQASLRAMPSIMIPMMHQQSASHSANFSAVLAIYCSPSAGNSGNSRKTSETYSMFQRVLNCVLNAFVSCLHLSLTLFCFGIHFKALLAPEMTSVFASRVNMLLLSVF